MLFIDIFMYLKCKSRPVLLIVGNKVCGRRCGSGRLFICLQNQTQGGSALYQRSRKYRESCAAAPVDGPLLWQLEWQQPWWFKSPWTRPFEAINSTSESNKLPKGLWVGLKRPERSRRTVAALLRKFVQVSGDFYDRGCLSLAGPASSGSPWNRPRALNVGLFPPGSPAAVIHETPGTRGRQHRQVLRLPDGVGAFSQRRG